MRPGDHGTDPWEGSEPERPIDIEALRADDEFIESLMSGGVQKPIGVRPPDTRSPGDVDAELRSMLSAWVLEVRPETVTAIESIALPAAVSAPAELVSPAAPDPAPATAPFAPDAAIASRTVARNRQPAQYFRRALVAASVVAVVGSGVAVGAYQSEPGGTLWPMTKVLYAEHARSVQAAADVTTTLNRARTALQEGRTGEAAEAIREVRATLGQVDPAQGRYALDQLQQELSVQLATVDPMAAATLNLPPSTRGSRGAVASAAGATPAPLTDRAAEAGSAPSVAIAAAPPVVTDPAVPVVTAPAPAVPAPVEPSPVEPAAPAVPEPDPATSGPSPSVAPADPATVPPPAPTTEPEAPPTTTVDPGPPANPTGSGAGTGPTETGTGDSGSSAPAAASDGGGSAASAESSPAQAEEGSSSSESIAGSLLTTITNAASETVDNVAAVAGN